MKKILDYSKVITGCILTAISFGMLIIPAGFSCGGITGLGVLLQKLVPLKLSLIVLLLNAALFVSGWVFVGKDFVIKTAITAILFPYALEFFGSLPFLPGAVLHPMLSAVLAGLLLGAGSALVLKGNGSCCGFDIPGVILHKYFGVSAAFVMNLCSSAVILLQYQHILPTLYGILTILITTVTMDLLMKEPEEQGHLHIAPARH